MLSEELRNFMATAECLNFTEASRHLHIAQPALSRQITRLEADLGVKLFDRTTRKVSLTPAGLSFLSLCRVFTVGCDSLLADFPRNALNEMNRGIVLGMGGLVETSHTVSIINRFVEENPHAPVRIIQYDDTELIEMLAVSHIDFAVVVLPLVPKSSGFEHCFISRSRFRVAVWRDHPLASRGKIKISDLENEQFIMNSMSPLALSNHLYKLCDAYGFFPKITGKASSNQLMYMMVSAKQGIAFSSIYRMNNTPDNVVFLEIDDSDIPTNLLDSGVAFVWSKSRCSSSPLMQRFIDEIRKHEFTGTDIH